MPVASSDPALLINELYPSIQGESSFAGRPCAFIRLTGCPLRCVWCDSAFSFSGGERLSVSEILARVASLGLPLVEVTGGEPLAQPNCFPLLTALCDTGYTVLLETSGTFNIAAVDPRVIKIIDFKCPDSGESEKNDWANLQHLAPHDELKFVLSSRADYDWACQVLAEHTAALAGHIVHFSPVVNGEMALPAADLAAWLVADRLPVHLQLQLHKLLWPGQTRAI